MTQFMRLLGTVVAALLLTVSASGQAQSPESTPPAAAPAKAPTRVSSGEQEKKLTKRVAPVYPKEAFDSKLTGVINIETTIGVDGKVTNLRLIGTGNALLVKAAEDAVKQWIYKPTVINGMPVEVVTIVQVNFKVGE